jgi:hypothetical protein
MPNTTNYSFPTPADTDLVKNGADAIRDLGDAVDTAMNTALGTKKAGMVLLNTTSFSAVSSVSLPANTFVTTYDNYQIVFSGLVSTTADINVRLRAAGTDNTTANSYITQSLVSSGITVSAGRTTSNLWQYVATFDTTLVNALVMDLFDPFLATPTGFSVNGVRSSSGGWTNTVVGTHNQTVSYDSATFICSAGTFTGKVSVYGRNK